MTPQAQLIQNIIDAYIGNYPLNAFKEMRLNTVLTFLNQRLDILFGGSGSSGTGSFSIDVRSADFTNATDCPRIILNGKTFRIFWNDQNRFLNSDEWEYLSGGGFRILIPGFDKSDGDYWFIIFVG